jgi:lysyl-tRNA synthetase class 2
MPSTVIGKIAYDPERKRLAIDFRTNGRRYVYFDVPPEVYDEFRHAFAKGSFFNRRIRDHYHAEMVFDPKAATLTTAGEEPSASSERQPQFVDRS